MAEKEDRAADLSSSSLIFLLRGENLITPNDAGEVECPQCHVSYTPKLERVPGKSMQEAYPGAKPIEREQLISGVGCDACWDEFVTGTTDKNCTCGLLFD